VYNVFIESEHRKEQAKMSAITLDKKVTGEQKNRLRALSTGMHRSIMFVWEGLGTTSIASQELALSRARQDAERIIEFIDALEQTG
jgi:hypothetical protein